MLNSIRLNRNLITVQRLFGNYSSVREILQSKVAKQTIILYGSQILGMIFGLGTSVIITRTLGPEKYGVFSFILAILSFTYLFFEFGFFSSGARLLALSKEKRREKELIGILLIITVGIALSFCLTLFIVSYFIDSIFNTSVGVVLRYISILAGILPFQYMLERMCQGLNEIKKMAIANLAPKIWYLAGLLVIANMWTLNVLEALVLNLSGVVIAVILIIWSLKPSFNHQWENFFLIWKENREYGLHVYSGRVVDVSTYQLDKLFISYFSSTLATGFYSLAGILTSPMALLSRSLSTSLFKGFALRERIPKKVIVFNTIWLLACLIGLGLLGRIILVSLFTDKYLPAAPLILPLAFAGFFQGLYQPYNMFFTAQGKGRWLRNMTWMMAGGNFLSNIALIPVWGAMGAAIASAVSNGFAIYLYLYFYYKKYLGEGRSE